MDEASVRGIPRRRRMAVALGAATVVTGLGSHQVAQAGGTAKAEVRVSQVGYAVGTAKRAFLMARRAETGAVFRVEDSDGHTVGSGPIGADQGSWSTAYPFVYAIDFNGVNTPGTYRIVVGDPADANSPRFRIASAAKLFARPMANALAFFQNSRDGANFIPSALRTAPGHLNDANAMTYQIPTLNSNDGFAGDLSPLGKRIDGSGAWWDAGDYLKFVETDSYVVAMMETGVRDFPALLGRGSGTSNFSAEAAFGLDFLNRMWDDTTRTLYIEVGIATGNDTTTGDHDIWRLPQADDTYGGSDPTDRYIRNRPVFRAGPPGSLISPNLSGRLAADFALCYQLERVTHPARARQCLLKAEHIFDLSNTNPGQLQTAVAFDFYPEKEWRDDLEWGATELSIALAAATPPSGLPHPSPAYYLKQAAHWAQTYITGPNDATDTLNLYDVSGLAHFELSHAIQRAGDPSGLEVTRLMLLADLKKQLDGARTQSASDPFGFGFPWAAFDTTSHGAGLAVTAAEYDELTGHDTYSAYGGRQLANILGANAWGTSLIVGDGSTFPGCMQHQVTNLAGSLNGRPPILAGAVVEGPNTFAASGVVTGMIACPASGLDRFAQFNSATAVYQDNVQSWSTVEPALDLTVSSPLAFAWQVNRDPQAH